MSITKEVTVRVDEDIKKSSNDREYHAKLEESIAQAENGEVVRYTRKERKALRAY